MGNVLLTGMTSTQASATLGRKTITFSALLERALVSRGHTVSWAPASVEWDHDYLRQFDSVIVGVAPVTSLSANYAYGALSVIHRMLTLDNGRLTLFVDAPQPRQVTAALRAVEGDRLSLFKPFYKNRREYSKVQDSAELMTYVYCGAMALLNETWPQTLYPSLPWKQDDPELKKALPDGAQTSLVGVSLDALITPVLGDDATPTGDRWVVDVPRSEWSESTIATLIKPVTPAKWHKGWTDTQIERNLRQSVGVLIAPHKPGGTWWTPRYMQALNHHVPVATEWKESAFLGSQWNVLAATIETMDTEQRRQLGKAQQELYLDQTPTEAEAVETLERLVGLKTGETK
jgi:hypothetical protein